jgi:1-acyl-sn-glycerol-3-phosphate acyltransferase
MVYLMGLKMQREWFSRFVSKGFQRIDIWPTSIPADTDVLKQQKHDVIRNAVRSVPQTIEQGKVICVYPEGGRSRTGAMVEAASQIEGYLEPDHHILPVGIWGTEKALPVGSRFPRFLSTARINIGEPFAVSDVIEAVGDVPRANRKKAIVDGIMKDHISPLLPTGYQGVYPQRR